MLNLGMSSKGVTRKKSENTIEKEKDKRKAVRNYECITKICKGVT
jgi:hypothetical protein